MKEQTVVIAEALERMNEDWSCAFRINKEIGEHLYVIAIIFNENKLELTAWLPVTVDSENYYEWVEKIRYENASLACGAFALSDDESGVYYRVYSPYTQADEVKGVETVAVLLNNCVAVLENHAEAMIARRLKKGLVRGFFELLGFI